MKSPRFNKGGIYVSFDAKKLHPSIILAEALELLEIKLKKDKTLHHKSNLSIPQRMHLTELCAVHPYFECELGIFQQIQGTPMGGPLSSFFADLVLENRIEATIKKHKKWGPKFDWVR
jgi:hypothetical protein